MVMMTALGDDVDDYDIVVMRLYLLTFFRSPDYVNQEIFIH